MAKKETPKKGAKTQKPIGKGKLTSTRLVPITKRTYNLETKRKGSTKGYKVKDGKYYKERKTEWSVERTKPGGKSVQKRKR